MSAALDGRPATRTGRKQKPYLARKASAQEIRETLGVTKADRKLVDAVFAKLGLLQGQDRSPLSKPSKIR
jgi:hypothetical protein